MPHAHGSQEFLPILGDQQKPNMHWSLVLLLEEKKVKLCHHLQEPWASSSQEDKEERGGGREGGKKRNREPKEGQCQREVKGAVKNQQLVE